MPTFCSTSHFVRQKLTLSAASPMTERLCKWNKDGEDISARGFPSEEYENLYARWGEGEIGIIVAGNIMLRYDALEAFGM